MSAASKKGGQRLWALFTETPHLSEAEKAADHIERHFEQRERHPIGSRPWHIERVKLEWWVKELLRVNEGSRSGGMEP